MRKIKRASAAVVSALTVFLSLNAAAVKAQEISSYLFLEVSDSSAKAVADATIEAPNRSQRIVKTSEYGSAQINLGYYRFSNFTDSLFKISKPGYFTFQDFGTDIGSGFRANVQIELLKIPQTKDELKAIGDEQRKREFLWAAKIGDAAAVREFLKSGISRNLSTDDLRGVSSPKNIPAVLFAAASGNAETVITLLKAGAKVRRADEPLHSILPYYLHANSLFSPYTVLEARKSKSSLAYEDGLKSLIKAGADVRALGKYGETTVMIAVEKGYAPMVKIFLDKGVSINAADNYGQTALMYAVRLSPSRDFLPPDAVRLSVVEMVKFLLASGADPNIVIRRSDSCHTVLFDAAAMGSTELISALMAGKADVKLTCEDGESALSSAAKQKQTEAVKLLIASGADVKGRQGQRAIAEVKKIVDEWERLADIAPFYRMQANDFKKVLNVLEAAAAAK
jgi:ankyrin repeat protein